MSNATPNPNHMPDVFGLNDIKFVPSPTLKEEGKGGLKNPEPTTNVEQV